MSVSQILVAPEGPMVSRIALGLWRLADWSLSPAERVAWIESGLKQGLTTFDHADIYGEYVCEGLFGEALARAPELRSKMQIVTKCGIKLPADACLPSPPNRPSDSESHSGKSVNPTVEPR